jgi:hypothetical protein
MRIKHRSLLGVFLLNCITLTLYQIYWFFITKTEMNVVNSGRDKVPFFLWFFVPIVNIWWFYRYCRGMEVVTKGAINKWAAFFLPVIIGVVVGVVFGATSTTLVLTTAGLTTSQIISYGFAVLLFSLPILIYQHYLNKVAR